MRKTVYISLGSNLGDREANLRAALEQLSALGELTRVSSFYETEPVDFLDQPWFLNCVAQLATEKMPRALLSSCLAIERKMGRRRIISKGPRIIDLDILLFGNAIVETNELTIPHPAMHERRFVLAPLAEIAPDALHPALRRTARQLLEALPPGPPIVRRMK